MMCLTTQRHFPVLGSLILKNSRKSSFVLYARTLMIRPSSCSTQRSFYSATSTWRSQSRPATATSSSWLQSQGVFWYAATTTTTAGQAFSGSTRSAATAAAAASTAVVAQPAPSRFSNFWRRLATVIRYVRIPVLIVSVYSLGYQQGVIDCTKQPVALQQSILGSVLVNAGCKTIDDVDIVTETSIKKHSSDRHHQVAAIGHRIVAAGRVYVERKLQEAVQAAAAKLGPSATLEQQKEAAERDETVQDWLQAQLRLDGEPIVNNSTKKNIALPNPHPWQYVFLKSPAPNAFVTEILPQRFFITTAMLDVATTPDEVAVVLGHEISHLILGHVSETNSIETFLRTLEVLLLSMDPTAGLVSVAIMGLLYAARQALSAAYSREHERQADELGLQLAALACFDTQKGSHVMYKMHQATTSGSTAQSSCLSTATNDTTSTKTTTSSKDTVTATVAGLLDSHPPTLARWEQMERTAREGENYTKHDHCASISSRFLHALWGKSNKAKQESANAASK